VNRGFDHIDLGTRHRRALLRIDDSTDNATSTLRREHANRGATQNESQHGADGKDNEASGPSGLESDRG
jgi:hypothetical protein